MQSHIIITIDTMPRAYDEWNIYENWPQINIEYLSLLYHHTPVFISYYLPRVDFHKKPESI